MEYEYKTKSTLKESLYQSLDKKGVLEGLKVIRLNIKAQLRSKLITSVLIDKNQNSKVDNSIFHQKYLNNIEGEKIKLIKLSCSLFSDFLKKNNLTYSQSVFIPEIGIQDLFTENELTSYFNNKITNFETSDNSILFSLIQSINKSIKIKIIVDNSSTQTDCDTNLDLDEKLKLIDNKYLSKISLESLMPSKLIEEKNIKYQRELEARMRNDMQSEVKFYILLDC